jgi:HK97 family phage portal protein
MKLFGFEISRKSTSTDDILRQIAAAALGDTGVAVTPDSAMQSPTVHAIVTGIANRVATLTVHVMQKVERNGRTVKELRGSHPVERLLKYPNGWQTGFDFWQDAASCLVRWGNFYAVKGRGSTGPIRELSPIHPGAVTIEQDDNGTVTYQVRTAAGGIREYSVGQILHVRGPSRDFLKGNSPVEDVRRAIGLEIAAEKFGASFFANGALPLMVFKYIAGSAGFKSKEDQQEFIDSFQRAYGGDKRHRALLLPKGIETANPVSIENDRAQYLQTRAFQRETIAGAFGVPPHMVGHLANSTYNNVEQQSLDFVINVVLPHVRRFESALEDSLLTDEDRNSGHIIRFNLDAALRGDFKSRQEGLKIMRDSGVINPNDWREMENMNPIAAKDGGEDFLRPMNMAVPGQEPSAEPAGTEDAESRTVA